MNDMPGMLAVVSDMPYLSRYEIARQSLAEARRVDEVQDIRNQALAFELYAKQAKDTELLKFAIDIRFRAERRAGEILATLPKAKGARGQSIGPGIIAVPTGNRRSLRWPSSASPRRNRQGGNSFSTFPRKIREIGLRTQGACRRHDDQRAELFQG